MLTSVVYIVILLELLILLVKSAPTITEEGVTVMCSEIPSGILEEVLGAAFNARYMSISSPKTNTRKGASGKRTADSEFDFYVDSEFQEDVLDEPAWALKNHVEITMRGGSGSKRSRRDLDYLQEWHCKSKIKWTDLGPDYFPRYLRSVECLTENCWFNIYKCKPRSFTVKILKRKRDRCVIVKQGTKIGVSGLPRDLKELWVWEERAVNFCCDCTL